VAAPEREDWLAVLFRRVNGTYAQAVNIRRGRSGPLWQARFHSCPLSPWHLWVAVRYVEDNPCRAGLVARPEEYRYSSAAVRLLGRAHRSAVLDLSFWRRAGGAETWAKRHGALRSEREVAALRKCTYGGGPFGDEEFVRSMEAQSGRVWRRSRADLCGEIAVCA
jgi:putative transposase